MNWTAPRIAALAFAGFVALADVGLLAAGPSFLEGWRFLAWILLVAAAATCVAVLVAARRPKETPMSTTERTEEVMYSVRHALLTQRMAALQASHDQLQAEVERLRRETAAAAATSEGATQQIAADPSEVVELRAELDRLAARLEESEDARRSAESRAAASEERRARAEAAQAQRDSSQPTPPAESADAGHLAEIARLRIALEASQAAEREAREATTEYEQDSVILRSQLASLPVIREEADRGRKALERVGTLEARIRELEASTLTTFARAELAEGSVRRLTEAQREAERVHTDEVAKLKEQISGNGEAKSLAAEAAALRQRAEAAEEAVRAALRELGVDPARWSLTSTGVVQAAGPLTLYALGEGTLGWTPSAPEDTLASAVLHVVQLAQERQQQIERLGAALARTGVRR